MTGKLMIPDPSFGIIPDPGSRIPDSASRLSAQRSIPASHAVAVNIPSHARSRMPKRGPIRACLLFVEIGTKAEHRDLSYPAFRPLSRSDPSGP